MFDGLVMNSFLPTKLVLSCMNLRYRLEGWQLISGNVHCGKGHKIKFVMRYL